MVMPLDKSAEKRRKRLGKAFVRQQWWFKPGLGIKWRKPRGHHSKMREQRGCRLPIVRVGYGSPSAIRALVAGKMPVVVRTAADLGGIDAAKGQVAAIASGVSLKNFESILNAAKAKGIPVINGRRFAKASHRAYEIEQKRKKRAEEKAAPKPTAAAAAKPVAKPAAKPVAKAEEKTLM
jgi:large subunit ribosomal protein L32e